MKQTAKRWLACAPSIFIMAAIYLLSSRTGDELNTFLPWFQKLFPAMASFDWGHFLAYFVLSLTFAYAFGRRGESWLAKLLIIVMCVAYGVTDEYHQSFVAGRTPDPDDLLHDGIGAALAVLLLAVPRVRTLWRRLVLRPE
ncbi:VanZ family protein [Paenibacillus sp. R14(2021)]|uniref:VanZ family protein n=1 Tax=Paenibacillus sp. R14(2021) TaxID=2859228 RepID=UPI001C613A2A|nr:VanZ family protein [Paenibacillus sp. R14(2021)]